MSPVATIYKRGEIWWARWYRADGKRVSASTKCRGEREAVKRANELEVEDRKRTPEADAMAIAFQDILRRAADDAAAGRLTVERAEEYLLAIRRSADPNFRVPTVLGVLREWVRDQDKRVKESTSRIYGDMATAVLKALRGDPKLPDFTHADAKRLLHALKVGRTGSTANLYFRAFRRALQDAVRAKLIADNPAQGVEPLPETDSTEKAPFTAEEVRLLIDAAPDEEWKGCILLAAHTGLRFGDVLKLSRSHVEGDKLVIRPTKTSRNRKPVVIPLTPPCIRWIGEKKGKFFPVVGALKPGTRGTYFTRIMKAAEVERTVTRHGEIASRSFHSLRHSFTSWLAEADIHADVRQKLTGHKSAGIHARYTHHDEALNEAVKALPDF